MSLRGVAGVVCGDRHTTWILGGIAPMSKGGGERFAAVVVVVLERAVRCVAVQANLTAALGFLLFCGRWVRDETDRVT
jgi:hypothetical protein